VRGRKPTPTALKVLHGETRPSRINQREPKHSPLAPGCPANLSAEAKAEWRRVVPALDRVGMLAKVDRAALAAYCECWSQWAEAQRDIRRNGLITEVLEREWKAADGVIHVIVRRSKNPAVLIARDCAAQIRLFAAEFGLTPSSRSRLEVPDQPDAGGQSASSRFLS
jgi:P27 family predicted phage terminase small subunit